MAGIGKRALLALTVAAVLSAPLTVFADWQDRMINGDPDDYDTEDSESRDGAIAAGIRGGLNESSLSSLKADSRAWRYYAIMEDGSMKAVEEDLEFEYEISASVGRFVYPGAEGTAVNLADGTGPVDMGSVSTDSASYPAVRVRGRNVPGDVYVILKYSAVEQGDRAAALERAGDFKAAVDSARTADEVIEAARTHLSGTVFTARTVDVFQTAFISASLGTTSTAVVLYSSPDTGGGYRFTRTGKYRVYSPSLRVTGSTVDGNGFYSSLNTGDFSGPCFALTQKYVTYGGARYWAVSDLLPDGGSVDYFFTRGVLLGSVIYEHQVETGQRDREADINVDPVYEVGETISAEDARHYIEPEPGVLEVDPLELGTRDIAKNLRDASKYSDLKETAASFYSLVRTLTICGLLISFMTGGIMLIIYGYRAKEAVSTSLLYKCLILVLVTGFAGFAGLAAPAIASVTGAETAAYEEAKTGLGDIQAGDHMNYWYYDGTG